MEKRPCSGMGRLLARFQHSSNQSLHKVFAGTEKPILKSIQKGKDSGKHCQHRRMTWKASLAQF